MAIPKHLEGFLAALERATEQSRVPWEEGASENEFLASMSDSSLRFYQWEEHEDRGAYGTRGISLWILNSSGKVADQISVEEKEPGFARIDALYDRARRKARGADDILRNLIAELGGAPVPPSSEDVPF